MRRCLALCAVVCVVAVASAPAAIAAEVSGLKVEVGYGGIVQPYRTSPIVVTGRAGEPFRATLEVTTLSQDPSPPERRKEVVARTTFAVTQAGPFARVFITSASGLRGVKVVVAGPTPVIAVGRFRALGVELIGVIASARFAPRMVSMTGVTRRVYAVEIPRALVSRSGYTLGGVAHLLVDARVVSALSADQREALLQFVAAGGDLVIAGRLPAGAGFPAVWRGGASASRVIAGQGTVTLMPQHLGHASWAGDGPAWQTAIAPRSLDREHATTMMPGLAGSLLESSGLRVPRPRFALPLLAVFLIVVGPLSLFVLRLRRRLELAWIVTPAIAVCFSLLLYAIGNVYRAMPVAGRLDVLASYLDLDAEISAVAQVSRYGEPHRLELPGGKLGTFWPEDPDPYVDAFRAEPKIYPVEEYLRSHADLARIPGVGGAISGARLRPREGAPIATIRNSRQHFTIALRAALDLRDPVVVTRGRWAPLDPDSLDGPGRVKGTWEHEPWSAYTLGGLLRPSSYGSGASPGFGELLATSRAERAFLIGVAPTTAPRRQRIVVHELAVVRGRGADVVADREAIANEGPTGVTRFRLPAGTRVTSLTLRGLLPRCSALPKGPRGRCEVASASLSAALDHLPRLPRIGATSRRDTRFSVFDTVDRRWVRVVPRDLEATLDPARVVSMFGEILVRETSAVADESAPQAQLWLTGRAA